MINRIMTDLMFVVLLLNLSCSSSFIGSDYELIKKYPKEIPNLGLRIVSDSEALVYYSNNMVKSQEINFFKANKNFLIVTYINNENKLIEYEVGDTILIYKNTIHFSNEKTRLLFKRK